ncbi:Adenosylmethionine-8-amino-7-oxononanoate aminotransferase [Stieleria maiorica]|uniref:Adenosylmethionine-8-amino-7-oxononanoate aminotransferase n=1 Tax=Stieleria maiorica TaxID=2795974 RepID=A0A5B9MJ81_9BACT|nr:adenosylmethionine--8-amino-7-oxononanoate transaminase [Stieleria maiorica]QEG00031.1 Adenosylmethionine-8-amino-7-oxononanoate aminotransferase [Stieleria maiorica]
MSSGIPQSSSEGHFIDSNTGDTPAWQQRGYEHLWMPYCQMKTSPMPLAVERTEGVYLHLSDGRRLIDGLASWWSACHGYNHPHVVDAMHRQLDTMPHVMFGGINHEPALTLADRLAGLLPGDLNRVFFCDSGSVAVEVAMKMAIQFHRNLGEHGRTRFLSFANAYHGDTTGAMSLCDPERSMHAKFEGALLQQFNVDVPRDDASMERFRSLLHRHRDQLAGVFIEPLVQGAGGMRFHSADVLRAIAHACRDNDVLLIADELATGFGRTGTLFAIEQADIVPDVICLGKALSAGMIGMAATVASDRVFDAFWSDDASKALMHGPTFMANPLACAAAGASLDLFEQEPRLDQARSIESALADLLAPCREIERVVDVRVKGAIGVIQVDSLDHVDRLRDLFVQQGVFIRPFGDCIYTTPPLVISSGELEKVGATMVSATSQWARWPRES